MIRFNVSYEIVTPESAEDGEAGERGFISEGKDLRSALSDLFETRTSECGGQEYIEPSDSDHGAARWITCANGAEFRTGARESRALHIPANVTAASRGRIARLAMRGFV